MKVKSKKIKQAKIKRLAKARRHGRVRSRVLGTEKMPRLSVFRSNKHNYVQLINDEKGLTLVSASDLEIKGSDKNKKTDNAKEIGKLIAKKALDMKISKVVFDRGGNKYHGRVSEIATGAREGGLKF
jgi:large subunit ribosomal protein L18